MVGAVAANPGPKEANKMRVILVPVADRPECAKALRAAFDLGKLVGASVSGCHIRPHRHPEVSLSMAFADAAWRKKSSKSASQHAETLYKQVAAENGYDLIRRARVSPGAMWSERVGSPGIVLSIVGPVADLNPGQFILVNVCVDPHHRQISDHINFSGRRDILAFTGTDIDHDTGCRAMNMQTFMNIMVLRQFV